MIVLEIQKLGKVFPNSREWAVKNFDMQVKRGEMYGLLGESGCGKTTILRMIAGFEKPSSGVITINGRIVSNAQIFVPPQERKIGIVFQDFALFPHKTVWENICFGLFNFQKSAMTSRAREVIELCGLGGLEKRYSHQLSGGQMQRVALARALAPKPEIILFDEPFSNIDTMRKQQIREDIADIIRKTQATAVFVTHDTKDVLAVAQKVSVLRNGKALQSDTPATIYAKPVNTYVADFFGKTNIIKAQVTDEGFQTSLGLFKSPVMPSIHQDEVFLSIRPEDFEITERIDNCFCGDVVKERFLGEYKEVTCVISDTQGKAMEVVIYTSPLTQCPENICYFRHSGQDINVLKENGKG